MKREFIINVLLILGLNFLIKVFYIFGIDRGVQNLVGREEYGSYFAILNLAYLFQIINDFGIRNFNNKHIAQYRHLLPKYMPNILVFKIFLGLIFMLLFLFSGYLLGFWEVAPRVMIGIGLSQILVGLIFYLRSNVSSLGYYRLDSFLSILDKALMILIIGAMIWMPGLKNRFNIEWFVWGQVISFLITAGLILIIFYRKMDIPRLRLNIPFLLVIIRESWPYAILGFLMAGYMRMDSVMLSHFVSDYETGIYASGFRLLEAGTMVGLLISGFLLPMFVQELKEKGSVEELGLFVIKMMWVGGVSLVVPVIVYRLQVMKVLYVEGDAYSGQVLGLLMIALLALMWSSVNGILLLAANEIRRLNQIYFLALMLNLILNWVLIPRWGAIGAAGTAAITQWLVTGLQFRILAKEGLLRLSFGLIIRLVLLLGLGVGWTWWLSSQKMDLGFGLLLSGAVIFGLSWILGLFSPQGLIKSLKNR